MSKGVLIVGAGALVGLALLLRSRPASAAAGLTATVPTGADLTIPPSASKEPAAPKQSVITDAFVPVTATIRQPASATQQIVPIQPSVSPVITNAISSGQSMASLTRSILTPATDRLGEARRLYSNLVGRVDLLLAEAGIVRDNLGLRSLADRLRRDAGSVTSSELATAADAVESVISPLISAARRDNASRLIAAMPGVNEIVLALTLQLDGARLDVGRRNPVGTTIRSTLVERLTSSSGATKTVTVTSSTPTLRSTSLLPNKVSL